MREEKNARRAAANLSIVEDTLIVASAMKASCIDGTDTEQAQGFYQFESCFEYLGFFL